MPKLLQPVAAGIGTVGPVIVIAGTIVIHPERAEQATAAALAMQEATLAEAGCVAYRFSFAVGDPSTVCIFEQWADQAALDEHFATPHMAAFQQALAEHGIVAGMGEFTHYTVSAARPLFG